MNKIPNNINTSLRHILILDNKIIEPLEAKQMLDNERLLFCFLSIEVGIYMYT